MAEKQTPGATQAEKALETDDTRDTFFRMRAVDLIEEQTREPRPQAQRIWLYWGCPRRLKQGLERGFTGKELYSFVVNARLPTPEFRFY